MSATASLVAGGFRFGIAGRRSKLKLRSESMNTQYTKLGHAMPVRASMAAAQSPGRGVHRDHAQSLQLYSSGHRGPTNLAKKAAVQA
eukprot:scaffold82099_cov67-Phaeocystis_antarctica.AAC.3